MDFSRPVTWGAGYSVGAAHGLQLKCDSDPRNGLTFEQETYIVPTLLGGLTQSVSGLPEQTKGSP